MKKIYRESKREDVKDVIKACKQGLLSWEEVARKAVSTLASVWKDDLTELFDVPEDTNESLEKRVQRLERKLK